MDAIDLAMVLCRRFEGLHLKPYICPAGITTVGYGSTYYLDGKSVSIDDPPITLVKAEGMLRSTLVSIYLPGVLRSTPNLLHYNDRLAAILDFAYNLGVGAYKVSTLAGKIKAEQWEEARNELHKWTRGGGKVLPGLVYRRKAESLLLM